MNSRYALYTRPKRRWFITMSVGLHILALGLLIWWLTPGPVLQTTQTPPSLEVTLAPPVPAIDSVPAVTDHQPITREAVATTAPTVEQTTALAEVPETPPVEPAAVDVGVDSDAATVTAETATNLYTRLLLSSRSQMAKDFALPPPSKLEQLSTLLNEPIADGTLVGRLDSERNWAGTQETLVVFDTVFGRMCSTYSEADPLDSLDRGVWRMLFGGCYQGN